MKISEIEKLRNHYAAKTILRQTKGVMNAKQKEFVEEYLINGL